MLLLIPLLSFSQSLEALKDFFNRKGYVVERNGERVIIDLGKGKAFVGEVFKVVREGKELVHPVTGKVLGRIDEEVGKVKVSEVEENFSFASALEDKGIEKGDRVELYYEDVCFAGSEQGFFKVSSLVGSLKKGEGCDYVVREFEEGFGVEFKGTAVAFFEKPEPKVVVQPQKTKGLPANFKLHARFVMTFPSLPLSVDSCSFFGSEKDYLAVLFESRLVIYELLEKEVVDYASVNLPSGYPVSVQCAPLDGDNDVLIVNMVTGSSVSSALVKMVGGSPVIVKKDIPYFLSVLDESKPTETFVGQKFDSRDLWGEVRKMKLSGDDLVEGEEFKVPSGFRLDSAVMLGDLLAFTDDEGYLRVYRGEELLLSEQDFSGSYTTVELPGMYEDDEKYTFNVRHFTTRVGGKDYLGVIKNLRSPVYRFLDVTKFSEGELYLVVIDSNGIATLKKLLGKKFEESVQGVVETKEEKLLVITGKTGTLPAQNRGDLFEAEIEPVW